MSQALSSQERESLINLHFKRAQSFNKIYLANHSLGRPLDQMVDDIARCYEEWFANMDEAWNPWLKTIKEFQTLTGNLLNQSHYSNIIPKTSAGQGLRAVLNSFDHQKPINIVTTTLEFDSIDTILRIYQAKNLARIKFVAPAEKQNSIPLFTGDELLNAIDEETDLVVFSAVNFTTGQIMPRQDEIIAKAHSGRARVLTDTYHSFGVLSEPCHPQTDFAIGGSYKYVHGGPGACWLYVSPTIANSDEIFTLDIGWFAKIGTFDYERDEMPRLAPGGRGWWESTPPVVTSYQALAGLNFLNSVGIDRLRATSLQDLSDLRSALSQAGIPIFGPPDPEGFGAFALLPCQDPIAITEKLRDHDIVVDARGTNVRLCPDILNTKKDFDVLAEVLSNTQKENSNAFAS